MNGETAFNLSDPRAATLGGASRWTSVPWSAIRSRPLCRLSLATRHAGAYHRRPALGGGPRLTYETLTEIEWERVDRVWRLLDEGQVDNARREIDALKQERSGHADLK